MGRQGPNRSFLLPFASFGYSAAVLAYRGGHCNQGFPAYTQYWTAAALLSATNSGRLPRSMEYLPAVIRSLGTGMIVICAACLLRLIIRVSDSAEVN